MCFIGKGKERGCLFLLPPWKLHPRRRRAHLRNKNEHYTIYESIILYMNACVCWWCSPRQARDKTTQRRESEDKKKKNRKGEAVEYLGAVLIALRRSHTHSKRKGEKQRQRERERELRVGNWISRGNLIPKRTERLAEQIQTRDEELVAQQRLKRLQLTFNT